MNAYTPHPALSARLQPKALCQLVTDWRGKLPAGGAIVEPKFDGWRMLWVNSELVTREGAPIEGVEHIADVLRRLEHDACVPMFFDGELLVGGNFEATSAHVQARGRNGVGGTFHIFDAMPMRVWRGEDVGHTAQARRTRLDEILDPIACDAVQPAPWNFVMTAAEVEELARDAIAAGGEGVVVKQALSTYRRAPSGNWQRIKRVLTADVRVIAVLPMADMPDRVGALLCDHKGVQVRVSAGMTDEQRKLLWEGRSRLLGSIVEVEALDRTARGSLRQARFVRVREDKR